MIKSYVGKVMSNKMQKTVVVLVERRVLHPKYKNISSDEPSYMHTMRRMKRKLVTGLCYLKQDHYQKQNAGG